MDRRVEMRRGVEDRGDLVRHHALLGVMGNAFELDLLIPREDRRIHAPAMAELVKLEPGHGIDNGRHFTPSHNATLRLNSAFRVSSIGIVISAVCITVQYDMTIPAPLHNGLPLRTKHRNCSDWCSGSGQRRDPQ